VGENRLQLVEVLGHSRNNCD